MRHRRFAFHFTPARRPGSNQVETWFGILTRQALRRSSVESVRALTAAKRALHPRVGRRRHPSFLWVKTSDEILAEAVRKTQADSGARR